MIGRARPALTLNARALAWLAQREHSRQELRHKLLRWAARQPEGAQPTPEDIEAALDALAAAQHLSDARFADSRIHLRQARHGLRRIEAELQRNGVDLAPAQRSELRLTELARATEVWSRRFGTQALTAADRARQMRFLLARGFDTDTALRVLKAAEAAEPAQAPKDASGR